MGNLLAFFMLLARLATVGGMAEFVLILALILLFVFRHRVGKKEWTVLLDILVALVCFPLVDPVLGLVAMGTVMFQAFYFGWYIGALLVVFPLFATGDILGLGISVSGLFLRFWKLERIRRNSQRDFYTRQQLQERALLEGMARVASDVERHAILSERARISRDLHDHMGYEIVAANLSLQTIRPLFASEDAELLELYDTGLLRLDKGVKVMREAVHDLSTVSYLGVDRLRALCHDPAISFRTFGDTLPISVGQWHFLETCLKESLTNISRHARATEVVVELRVTKRLVRLSVENDGTLEKSGSMGTGLRNLRYRVQALGGHLTAHGNEKFRLVCVLPVEEEFDEADYRG